MPKDIIRFVEDVPEFGVKGDVVRIEAPGMESLVFPLPVFRAAVFKSMALIREIDDKRRKNAGIAILACHTCGFKHGADDEHQAARS